MLQTLLTFHIPRHWKLSLRSDNIFHNGFTRIPRGVCRYYIIIVHRYDKCEIIKVEIPLKEKRKSEWTFST